MAALRDRVDHLERENLEFRQQVGYWKSRHRDALRRIAAVGADKSNNSKARNANSKPISSDDAPRPQPLKDRSNHLDDPQDDSQAPKRKRGQQPGNPGPKRRDYSHLPVREEFVELPPEQCVCPDCGQPLRLRSDTEDSEQIEIEVSCLPPRDSPAAVRADLHLRGQTHPHRSTSSQADSQRPIRHFGLGRDPPGQVFQLSAHRTLAGLLAAVGTWTWRRAPSPTACSGWKSCCGRSTRRSSSGILKGICIRR